MKCHPSIAVVKNLSKGSRFDFCRVSAQDAVKEIKKLSTRKATQYADLPSKILKEDSDIFRNFVCDFFNDCILPASSKVFEKLLVNKLRCL